jgi:hypothetical protein
VGNQETPHNTKGLPLFSRGAVRTSGFFPPALSRVSHYALCPPKPHAAAWAPQAGGRRRVSPCTAVQDEIDNSVPV